MDITVNIFNIKEHEFKPGLAITFDLDVEFMVGNEEAPFRTLQDVHFDARTGFDGLDGIQEELELLHFLQVLDDEINIEEVVLSEIIDQIRARARRALRHFEIAKDFEEGKKYEYALGNSLEGIDFEGINGMIMDLIHKDTPFIREFRKMPEDGDNGDTVKVSLPLDMFCDIGSLEPAFMRMEEQEEEEELHSFDILELRLPYPDETNYIGEDISDAHYVAKVRVFVEHNEGKELDLKIYGYLDIDEEGAEACIDGRLTKFGMIDDAFDPYDIMGETTFERIMDDIEVLAMTLQKRREAIKRDNTKIPFRVLSVDYPEIAEDEYLLKADVRVFMEHDLDGSGVIDLRVTIDDERFADLVIPSYRQVDAEKMLGRATVRSIRETLEAMIFES